MSHEPMHRVIRLKRYEQPPEGYFDDFLRDFHRRQRAELLKPSLRTLLMERLHALLSEFRVPTMAFAGAAAVAVIASIAILSHPAQSPAPRAFAASYQQTPVTITKMQPVSLRVDPQSQRSASLFPPAYMLNARPANHESPLSF
ncbi:MAG: hypothetical protein WAL87_06510 [Chthoniobacterales bacterium]